MAIPVPPVPNPIQSPNFNASGVVTTSGTSTSANFDGPWFVEEQSLDITYQRVPGGSLSSVALDLDSVAATHRIDATYLVAEVQATYRSYKDWGTYDTSNWQQPQTFEFVSFSADSLGETYGAVDASTLGPMGSIVTDQAYYRRVPWGGTASGHVEVNKQCNGATYFATQRTGLTTSASVDQTPYKTQYKYWVIASQSQGTFLGDWEVNVEACKHYYIGGPYATSQENLYKIFQFIDNIGSQVATSKLADIPATNIAANPYNIGLPEYRITRHDYQ